MKSAKFHRGGSVVGAIVAVLAIGFGAVASAGANTGVAHAAASPSSSGRTGLAAQENAASFLKGTWVGKAAGYNGGKYQGRNEAKFVITEVRGFSAKGTQQWRSPGAKSWSTAESVYFTLLFEDGAGLWQIYGAEGDATYFGSTTQDGGMYLIYLEPGRGTDDAAMRITLKKRG
jgi:hypothetical protein